MMCFENFWRDFTAGISAYIEDEPINQMCDAAHMFKHCLYKTSNLPAKILMGRMELMACKFYDDMGCKEIAEGKLN